MKDYKKIPAEHKMRTEEINIHKQWLIHLHQNVKGLESDAGSLRMNTNIY